MINQTKKHQFQKKGPIILLINLNNSINKFEHRVDFRLQQTETQRNQTPHLNNSKQRGGVKIRQKRKG